MAMRGKTLKGLMLNIGWGSCRSVMYNKVRDPCFQALFNALELITTIVRVLERLLRPCGRVRPNLK